MTFNDNVQRDTLLYLPQKKYRMRAIITHSLYIIFHCCLLERFVFQTIYVLNKEILKFLGLKSAVYNRERFQIKSGL